MKKNSSEVEIYDETAKAREAYGLHLQGLTWSAVAEQVGYENGDSARQTVHKVLKRASLDLSSERLEEMLNTELDRLDMLQAALWPMAIAGDTRSVDTLLRVMSSRHKLLGFDRREDKITNQTLIVNSDNFIEVLQQAVENRKT